MKPKALLHMEGAAVLLAAGVIYHRLQGSWVLFALLFLFPDVFMCGYGINRRLGAMIYNVAHTYTCPILWLGAVWASGPPWSRWLGIIWLAHIGLDRLAGYGLKYETSFKETHLQRV